MRGKIVRVNRVEWGHIRVGLIAEAKCADCNGRGQVPGDVWGTNQCKPCKGTGHVDNFLPFEELQPHAIVQGYHEYLRSCGNRVETRLPPFQECDQITVTLNKGELSAVVYFSANREDEYKAQTLPLKIPASYDVKLHVHLRLGVELRSGAGVYLSRRRELATATPPMTQMSLV